MSIVEYRKVKCDNCRKEKIIRDSGSYPSGWLVIEIYEWDGMSGRERLHKEVCSGKCALEIIKKVKKIPECKTINL